MEHLWALGIFQTYFLWAFGMESRDLFFWPFDQDPVAGSGWAIAWDPLHLIFAYVAVYTFHMLDLCTYV